MKISIINKLDFCFQLIKTSTYLLLYIFCVGTDKITFKFTIVKFILYLREKYLFFFIGYYKNTFYALINFILQ